MSSGAAPRVSPAVAAARVIAVDRVTAEVVAALRGAGVAVLVLKGPALAAALYDRGELRLYGDTDVLVPPGQRADAERVLRALGFEGPPRSAYAERVEPHAINYSRAADRANVDLHRTLPMAAAEPQLVWDVAARDATTVELFGTEIPVPGSAVLALHVATHVTHHGKDTPRPFEDLRRAAVRFDDETWRRAAELAELVGLAAPFAHGLRFTPESAVVASRLRITARPTPDVALAAQTPPTTARGWLRLARASGPRGKARTLRRAVMPTPEYMRAWWYHYQRRPPAPLPVMYARRWGHLVTDAPRAIRAVLRARRDAR